VEDVYFTGGLTDPAKTDFFIEYRGEDGRWHRYTPDFVIRKRARPGSPPGTGKVLIVEIKDARFRAAIGDDQRRGTRGEEPLTAEGRKAMALRRLEGLNPERLRYEILFADGILGYDQLAEMRRFVQEPERAYLPDLATATRLKEGILAVDGGRARRVILFGSRARGDAQPDSDYDLLILVRGMTAEEVRAYRLELWRALRGAGVSAEPWVMDETEFEESKSVIGGLAHPAWTEGVLLHENA
jgi:predicted nucleotidyltransferase